MISPQQICSASSGSADVVSAAAANRRTSPTSFNAVQVYTVQCTSVHKLSHKKIQIIGQSVLQHSGGKTTNDSVLSENV